MSFTLLLFILSLVVIAPVFFVIKSNKNKPLHIANINMANENPAAINQQNIDLKSLPNLYQQIILDIEAQFFEIKQKNDTGQLAQESFFTAKKLFYTRLPELISDYQKLDAQYAKTQIIDTTHQLTSFDIVYRQLKSILNLFYQINQSSNQLYLQNILTNQRYLQSVEQAETGTATLTTITHLPQTAVDNGFDINNTPKNLADSDYQAGQAYLGRYMTTNTVLTFSQPFVSQIGQLVYFASITQLAIESELGEALAKLQIRANLELEALSNLLQYQLPQKLHTLQQHDSHAQEQVLILVFEQLLQLLNAMLATLDKPLNTADKLALIQNLHDDFADVVDKNF